MQPGVTVLGLQSKGCAGLHASADLGVCAAQVVFQPQKDEKAQMEDAVRAQMTARNDPSAPAPVPDQEERKAQVAKKPYQFLLVSRLREYLALEFRIAAPFPVDVERVYDDFGALLAPDSLAKQFLGLENRLWAGLGAVPVSCLRSRMRKLRGARTAPAQ